MVSFTQVFGEIIKRSDRYNGRIASSCYVLSGIVLLCLQLFLNICFN